MAGEKASGNGLAQRAREVHEAAAPSIVRVGRRGGRGCGIVIDTGFVVTNAHNLRDRTTEITFADGRAIQARASGVDIDDDLVVLEVDTGDAPALTWADEPGNLGDPVFAVARTSDGTRVTSGTVSGVGRVFRGPRGRRLTHGLEHTAPVARGTSGSPVLDADGHLVGISTLRLGDGFTIALPASAELRSRIEDLRAGRSSQRRRLGVGLAPAHITRRLRRAVGLADREGVLVRMVESNSPAERAGLQRGDLITKVGDGEVTSPDDVASALDRLQPGATLALHLVRGAEELDIVVSFESDVGETTTEHGEA